jgi:putative SOS response-associated peptidase YedK
MCGRFTLTVDPGRLQEAFPGLGLPVTGLKPRYNIAPTQPVALIPNDGDYRLDFYLWGLIPSWAKDAEIGNRLINARGETLAEKPAFRAAFRRRRCLILADGFFEWRQDPDGRGKTPVYISLRSHDPFGFAGLWEIWHAKDGSEVRSCTIITTQPNELVAHIHNRMPVILPASAHAQWLAPGEADPAQLAGLIRPYPAEEMTAHPVARLVNSPANDSPECVAPLP